MNNVKRKKIFFRADGNSEIGLGHLFRSSALAGMLNQEYTCILVTRCDVESLSKDIKSAFSQIISVPVQDYWLEAQNFDVIASKEDLIVLDGYCLDSNYQKVLVNKGFELFAIDDIHAYQFQSRVIINSSGGITPFDYHSLPSTQYYLGPHYALLRNSFLQAVKHRRKSITDKNCFICFGGADPQNMTLEILQTKEFLNCSLFECFHVVVGNAYKYKAELDDFSKKHKNIFIHYAISTEEMVSVMSQCSYAICSPSTVVYEYLSVGGIVFLEQIADNQKDVINYLTQVGLAFPLHNLNNITKEQIESAFNRGAFYFDGKSGERFKKLFQKFFEAKQLTIRKAEMQDIEQCYKWANDPEVRKQSYKQDEISYAEHISWFTQKLNDRDSYYYILEIDREPVAQIRFQVSDGEVLLGYLAGSSIRSKGLGTAILGKGIEAFIYDYGKPAKIVGYVKETNIASQRSFERMAFFKEKTINYPDSFKYTLTYGV